MRLSSSGDFSLVWGGAEISGGLPWSLEMFLCFSAKIFQVVVFLHVSLQDLSHLMWMWVVAD